MFKRCSHIFILLICSPIFLVGQTTNEGTDFWLAFMEHRNVGNNTMVVMISSKTSTTGTVSMPLLGFSTPFSVAANDVTLITMPASAETIGSEQIQRNGIHVTSIDPVSVYIHQYQNFRAEASIVLPVSSISNEYYVLSYRGISQQDDGATEFVVVGIEPKTTISILLTDDSKNGRTNGDRFNVTLNPGETYQVRGNRIEDDFTGTHITGDKNFAVFAGASYARIPVECGNRDNLLEQMYPVSTIGNTYVTAPTRQGDFNVFRILAIEDNSNISIRNLDGTTESISLNEGEFFEYRRSVPTIVENTATDDQKGFMLAQYIVGSECTGQQHGGPAMVLLSSIEQIRETVTVYNSSFQQIRENYISIICKSEDTGGIRRNGNLINTSWELIGLNNELAFTITPVSTGRHTITSDGCGVIAMAFGLGEAEGYAYFGGASFNEINSSPLPDGECVGNPVMFDSGLPEDRYDVEWITELGDTIIEHQFSYDFPDTGEGQYMVQLKTFDNCFLVKDSTEKLLKMTFQTNSTIDDNNEELCNKEMLSLETDFIQDAAYVWTGPDNYEAEGLQVSIQETRVENSGTYIVQANVFGCLSKPDSIDVLVRPLPQPFLGQDSVICDRLPIPHSLNPGVFTAYEWNDGSQGSTLDLFAAGEYTVRVTDMFGCSARDSIQMAVRCPTAIYVPTAFSPNDDGINDIFDIQAFDVTRFDLSIFDRWGNEFFSSETPDLKWDGFFNAQQAMSGLYSWILRYEGYDENGNTMSETLHGYVQLMR